METVMGAFILAGLAFLLTCIVSMIILFATGMSTTGTTNPSDLSPGTAFVVGSIISLMILGSHWVHIGW